MKRWLNILASSICTTLLASVLLSIFYYSYFKPLKRSLPSKEEVQAVNKELIKARLERQQIQEQLDRQSLQNSLANSIPSILEENEVAKLENEMKRLEELKKEVARLEAVKKRVQCLTTGKTSR